MSTPAAPSEDTISVGGDELTFRVTSELSDGVLERFVREAGATGEAGMASVPALASAHGIELTRPVEETA